MRYLHDGVVVKVYQISTCHLDWHDTLSEGTSSNRLLSITMLIVSIDYSTQVPSRGHKGLTSGPIHD